MNAKLITRGAVAYEDSGVQLLGRLEIDAVVAQQASLSAIDYVAWEVANYGTASEAQTQIDAAALTVADVIFNALQTDKRWTADTVGYNFRWTVPASLLPNGDRIYVFEVKFTPAAGQPCHHVWEVPTANLRRS